MVTDTSSTNLPISGEKGDMDTFPKGICTCEYTNPTGIRTRLSDFQFSAAIHDTNRIFALAAANIPKGSPI